MTLQKRATTTKRNLFGINVLVNGGVLSGLIHRVFYNPGHPPPLLLGVFTSSSSSLEDGDEVHIP